MTITQTDVLTGLAEVLEEVSGVTADKLTREATFQNDLEVDSLTTTLDRLTAAGLKPGTPELPGGPDGPKTSFLADPDGYRIELVEWPSDGPPVPDQS